jgi:hypothetical protein
MYFSTAETNNESSPQNDDLFMKEFKLFKQFKEDSVLNNNLINTKLLHSVDQQVLSILNLKVTF